MNGSRHEFSVFRARYTCGFTLQITADISTISAVRTTIAKLINSTKKLDIAEQALVADSKFSLPDPEFDFDFGNPNDPDLNFEAEQARVEDSTAPDDNSDLGLEFETTPGPQRKAHNPPD